VQIAMVVWAAFSSLNKWLL